MPTGIVQPGGPGTPIYVYDHVNGAADPVNGYDLYSEILVQGNALDPANVEEMKGPVSGLIWGGARRQFLVGVPIVMGGQNADGSLPTYMKGSNVDLYFRTGGRFDWRTIGYSSGLFQTKFGTRIASVVAGAPIVSGTDGVDIMSRTNIIFRGPVFLYGSEGYADGGNIQILFPNLSEIGGCLFRASGSYVIGNDTPPFLDVYNTTFAGTTTGSLVTAMSVRNSDNPIFACANPLAFITSGAINLRLSNAQFAGSPSGSDLRWNSGGGSGWFLFCPQYSETVGKPRFVQGTGGPPLPGTGEGWYFNVRVGNQDGWALNQVPVRVESDLDGLIIDTITSQEGDIGFTNGTIGIPNAVRVRDHYLVGGIYTVRDRIFTCTVNGYGSTLGYQPLPNYETRRFKFQWPGKDVFQGAYSPAGGSFRKCIMPVMLRNGAPSTPVIMEECSL